MARMITIDTDKKPLLAGTGGGGGGTRQHPEAKQQRRPPPPPPPQRQQQHLQQQQPYPPIASAEPEPRMHEPIGSETSSLAPIGGDDDEAESSSLYNARGGGSRNYFQRSNWRLFGLFMFFLFYLSLGATVFSSIERPLEKKMVQDLLQEKRQFLKKHPCLTDDDLEAFMEAIVYANNRGVEIFKNGTSVSSWTFGQSFFFSSTVVTTIGYGHQSPLSSEGKVFCIFYAVLGIPMTLLLLTAVVERALVPVNALLQFMLRRLVSPRCQPVYVHVAHFCAVVLLVVSLFFLLPAGVFAALEPKWGFLDSLYYCFISLTTIGLGDFIPGDSPGQEWRPLYKACTTFYLLVGVTAMMLTLAVFYSIPSCDLQLLFHLPQGAADCLKGASNGVTSAVASSSAHAHSSSAPGQSSSSGGARRAGDPERIRLQTAGGGRGPRYTQQLDEHDDEASRRQKTTIRARSRPNDDDSPSPVEEAKPRPGGSGGSKGGRKGHHAKAGGQPSRVK